MKQVCIVTFYNSLNFGSRLQALALSKSIDKLGYEASFLRYFKARKFTLKHPHMVYARICKRLGKEKNKNFFEPIPYQASAARRERMAAFTKENYREMTIDSDETWREARKKGLIYVSGSDIIWNPAIGYPSYYFLDFAYYAKQPCIAYASSVGALELPKKYQKAYRRYLNRFKAIGVRENATIEMLSKVVENRLTKVVDPTLLLTSEEWDAYADKAQYSEPIEDRYIFCYFVMHDQTYWDYAKMVQEQTGLQVVVLPMHHLDEEQPFTIIKDGTPYEFIDLIRRAEFVLTDSFHTGVFSLQYKKEFYLLRRDRKAEDAKFNELLSRYGLEDRVITDRSRFERKPEIDYEAAHAVLKEDREASKRFLAEALSSCDR